MWRSDTVTVLKCFMTTGQWIPCTKGQLYRHCFHMMASQYFSKVLTPEKHTAHPWEQYMGVSSSSPGGRLNIKMSSYQYVTLLSLTLESPYLERQYLYWAGAWTLIYFPHHIVILDEILYYKRTPLYNRSQVLNSLAPGRFEWNF